MGAVIPFRREAPAPRTPSLRVSIVIKALDEESHIRGSLESAIAAAMRVGGEVILADCGSSDRTVEIAREYPVTVVQPRNPDERRRGVGSQLGFERARAEFVYILDGDMELDPDFLPRALAAMEGDSQLAGIAGVVEEAEGTRPSRALGHRPHERRSQACEWLERGGLYRAEALRDVGYLSNRNLHGLEELELGLRLCAAGWTLRRLGAHGVVHHGRAEGRGDRLRRRWKNRSLDGSGELIRASLGRPYFYRSLQTQRGSLLGLLV
ncbi:MAG TPA: glycosyltransferase, partial [Steroidobacteraceae bacterium]|nr:glycosyltransferase [Steroidobacteraceae bacterium]